MSNAGPVTKLSELLLIDFSAISAISFFFFSTWFYCPISFAVTRHFRDFVDFPVLLQCNQFFFSGRKSTPGDFCYNFTEMLIRRKLAKSVVAGHGNLWFAFSRTCLAYAIFSPWLFIIIVVGVWCDLVRKRPEEMPTEMVISATSYSFQFSTPASWVKASCVCMGHATCL